VNPNGQTTTWHFEYGTTTSYGTKTAAKSAGQETKPANVSVTITGLSAGTTYHFRLAASKLSSSGALSRSPEASPARYRGLRSPYLRSGSERDRSPPSGRS